MLSHEDNDRLTRVAAGTPVGELFRRYWLPVAVSAEVGDVPRRVRYLGEDLVLFRDENGRPGLLGLHCPHRLTSFEFGRVECGGIRCIYHGWLFDVEGRCLDQPGETNSSFKDKVHHLAYPCRDIGGLVFAYMGPGEPPLPPHFEILWREDCTRHAGRDWMVHPCNWLQIVENDMDPVHAAVLHGDPAIAQNSLFPNMPRRVDFIETELGIQSQRYIAGPEQNSTYKRIVNMFLPGILAFGGGKQPDNEEMPEFGGSLRWRVPIDDVHTASFRVYVWPHQNGRPVELPPPRDMGGTTVAPDVIARSVDDDMWWPERDARGRYVLDTSWKQDYAAIVSQGAVMDRSHERLGTTDRGIILMRRKYLAAIKAVEEGHDPPGVVREGALSDMIRLPQTNYVIRGKSVEEFVSELD